MHVSLEGKVALITGGSRGIGKAIASELAASGAQVMISSRKQDALAAAADEIRAVRPGAVVETFAANAGDPEAAAACIDATIERLGGIDVLVNNAATNPYFGPTLGVQLSQYDKTFEVNMRGPLVWSQLAWQRAFSEAPGVIVNIASLGGIKAEHGLGVYNLTKAALIHFTRQLASEIGPTRVVGIAPGLVKTDFAGVLVEHFGEGLAARLPMKRLGEPEDIANLATFLASDAASWITGETFVIDGGAAVASSL